MLCRCGQNKEGPSLCSPRKPAPRILCLVFSQSAVGRRRDEPHQRRDARRAAPSTLLQRQRQRQQQSADRHQQLVAIWRNRAGNPAGPTVRWTARRPIGIRRQRHDIDEHRHDRHERRPNDDPTRQPQSPSSSSSPAQPASVSAAAGAAAADGLLGDVVVAAVISRPPTMDWNRKFWHDDTVIGGGERCVSTADVVSFVDVHDDAVWCRPGRWSFVGLRRSDGDGDGGSDPAGSSQRGGVEETTTGGRPRCGGCGGVCRRAADAARRDVGRRDEPLVDDADVLLPVLLRHRRRRPVPGARRLAPRVRLLVVRSPRTSPRSSSVAPCSAAAVPPVAESVECRLHRLYTVCLLVLVSLRRATTVLRTARIHLCPVVRPLKIAHTSDHR